MVYFLSVYVFCMDVVAHILFPYTALTNRLLGEFAKLRKSTVSFVMSVCPSVLNEQLGSYWTYFQKKKKVDIWEFFENLSRIFEIH